MNSKSIPVLCAAPAAQDYQPNQIVMITDFDKAVEIVRRFVVNDRTRFAGLVTELEITLFNLFCDYQQLVPVYSIDIGEDQMYGISKCSVLIVRQHEKPL